ncbi:MAG: DNA polymerase III subunit gamma/tau [Candidatus Dojkabacteria bacterium]
MALYQKYRAKTFREVLTQGHVVDILRASVMNKTFGHAYLFVGTRGTGKTSLARIFARALNCSNEDHVKKTGEPCNECDNCKASLGGNHPDIIEMDAASNRGIEEVRNLRGAVDFLPNAGLYKVYIIDEAHMMTKEAFNALLKTIEEPPKHVLFILCTTEVYKIPPTILSRSQVFELKHASLDEIIAKIDTIIATEGVQISDEGKKLIARLGKGSFRDAESILEKVITSADARTTTLELEDIVHILGLSSVMTIEKVKNALYGKQIEELITLLEQNIDDGGVGGFNYQLAGSVYEDIIADYKNGTNDATKSALFDFLATVERDIRSSSSPKLVYTARILHFLQEIPVSAPAATPVPSSSIAPKSAAATPVPPKKNYRNNPSAMLRQMKQKNTATTGSDEKAVEDQSDASTPFVKRVSKIDFLNFVKDRNTFLYRFFSHHEYEIKDGLLLVNPQKKMEKDLLSRPATQELVQAFGVENGTPLVIKFQEVEVDISCPEEQVIAQEKKKVEDLSEEEIKEIFDLTT